MSKRDDKDPLMAEIRHELRPGEFIRWDAMSRFTADLQRVQDRIAALAANGEAERALRLYEVFLAGVYAKIESCDDDGYLSLFFTSLFCGWIQARQALGRPPQETVHQILNWMKNDQYGFCHRIEKEVVKALETEGRRLFINHFQGLVDEAMPAESGSPSKPIFEYENDVRLPAMRLKEIYRSLNDPQSYAALCEKLGLSPLDCQRLAEMEMSKRNWARALEWVEKGIALEPTRNWHNESSLGLERLRPELASHLGGKEDALALAWAEFQNGPNDLSYERLMRFVPKREQPAWRDRAIRAAERATLGSYISLCVKVKDWERLSGKVHSVTPAELEAVSHYSLEPAAKGLTKPEPLAAAKLYRALGLRIVNAGKSKYYDEALRHLQKACDLYGKVGEVSEWEGLVQMVRTAHSRKVGFLVAFERIVAGEPPRSSSFGSQARERWKRLTS